MNPERALEIIEPYAGCEVVGDSPEQGQKVRSIVCAVIGDCYRELGEVCLAAEWYRSAAGYWKLGGFPSFYADTVITHRLVDHFETALECLKANDEWWRNKPVLTRLYYHVVSGWWLHPAMWQLRSRERSFIPLLEALIKDRDKST